MATLTRNARTSSGTKVVRVKKSTAVKVPAWRAVVVESTEIGPDPTSRARKRRRKAAVARRAARMS